MSNLQYGIAWSDKYKLGNDKVDSQHYKLFEMVSNLVGACMDGSDIAKLRETLNFLVTYTVQHFNDEEALQLKYHYPEYIKHKKLHEDFKATVLELVKRFGDSGSPVELSNDVNKIVIRWLINHINIEDRKIGAYIKKCDSSGQHMAAGI